MTETPAASAPKRRKYSRRKKASAAPPKSASEFVGITATDCCAGCNVNGCVISGSDIVGPAYCAHPYKGGLHASEINNPQAFARLNAAKKLLGKKKVIVGADI